jgi:hypothetical protein
LVDFASAVICGRCGTDLLAAESVEGRSVSIGRMIFRRSMICILVCLFVLAGFYLSLIGSAKSLSYDDKKVVTRAIAILGEKGFTDESYLLQNLTAFRANDNWLNASVEKENAYAATNFPFEIITLYPDFFSVTADDTERAAILLHEAKHLAGKDERESYEFVWKHRKQLGWIEENYHGSPVWRSVRKQTKDNVPLLFVCDFNVYGDCTQ